MRISMMWMVAIGLVAAGAACGDKNEPHHPVRRLAVGCTDNTTCQTPGPNGLPKCASDTLSYCDMNSSQCVFVLDPGRPECKCYVGQTQSCVLNLDDCSSGVQGCKLDGSGFDTRCDPAPGCPADGATKDCTDTGDPGCGTGKRTYKSGHWGACVPSCTGMCTVSPPQAGCNQGVYRRTAGATSCVPTCSGTCPLSPPQNGCDTGFYNTVNGQLVCGGMGGGFCVAEGDWPIYCGPGTMQCDGPGSTSTLCVRKRATCPDAGMQQVTGTIVQGENLGDGRWVTALKVGNVVHQLGPISGPLGEAFWSLGGVSAQVKLLVRPVPPNGTLVAEDYQILGIPGKPGSVQTGLLAFPAGSSRRALQASRYLWFDLSDSPDLNALQTGDYVYVVYAGSSGSVLNVTAAGRLSRQPWPDKP